MKTVGSENPWIRLGSTWLLGFAILLVTWVFSFRTLPESVARGSSGVYYVPILAGDCMATFYRIFLWNLCVGFIPVAIGNLVRIRGVPLGYLLTFYHWGVYGLLLGTNSFVIPGPGKFLPSLITLFYGSGVYEISSYTLISSATFNFYSRYGDSASHQALVRKRVSHVLRLSRTRGRSDSSGHSDSGSVQLL